MGAPTQASQLRAQALAALQQKRDADAAEMLTRYLDCVPNDREAELALAVARSGQGRYGAALAIFDRHLEKEPRSAVLHFNRGMTLERMGKKFEAEKAYREVLRLKPDHAKARQRLDALTGTKAPPAPVVVKQPRPVSPPPKPVAVPPSVAADAETIPEVVAVEDDEPIEVVSVAEAPRGKKKDRWIHPLWLVGLFVYAATAIGMTAWLASAYVAGRVTGELLLASILLLAGIQAIHDARRGRRGRPIALGIVFASFGGLAMLASAVDTIRTDAAGWQARSERIAKEKEWQAGAVDRQAKADAQWAAIQERSQKDQAEAREAQKKRASERVDKALADIRSGVTSRIVSGCMSLWTMRDNDRKTDVNPALENLLGHSDAGVRMQAADALGVWGTLASIPKLGALLREKNVAVRSTAQGAIDKIRKREPGGDAATNRDFGNNPGLIDTAIKAIRGSSFTEIMAGCAALADNYREARKDEVIPLLEGLLTHTVSRVRLNAAKALGIWGTQDSIAKLEALADDDNPMVQSAAKFAIEKIKQRK